jgi:hypothetical protein
MTRVRGEDRMTEAANEAFRLERTGTSPLVFNGVRVAQVATGPRWRDWSNNRWHEIRVYRTRANWIVGVRYRTEWVGESEKSTVQVCKTPREVAAWLEAYQPVADATGLLVMLRKTQDTERAARVADNLTDRCREAVSQVLGALDIEERID